MLPSPERVEMLLAVIASIAVRSRLTAGGRWIRTCMGLFPVKWLFSVYCQFFVRSGKGPFFIPSLRSGSRSARSGVKGPKR